VMLKCHRKHPHLNSCANKIEVWDVFFRWSKSDSGWFRSIFIHFFEFDKKKWIPHDTRKVDAWKIDLSFSMFLFMCFSKKKLVTLGAPPWGRPVEVLHRIFFSWLGEFERWKYPWPYPISSY
jgi:hypothetical protein